MKSRPSFSLSSVAERMRHLESDVPDVIRSQAATKVEEYLLDQTSFLNQQNIEIAKTLDEIVEQTTKTNGRVTNQEAITSAQQTVIDAYKAVSAKWHRFLKWFLAFLALVGVPVANTLFKLIAIKLGLPTP